MKKTFHSAVRAVPIFFILVIVWCIWSESFSPQHLIEGAILGSVALIITNRIFLNYSYQNRYRISVFTIIRYMLVLVVEIFRSGYHAIYITVTNKIHVGVVDLPTKITNSLHGVLTASAITLTPGTVTIDYSPGKFKVIWIDCYTTDAQEASEAIKGKFERVLIKEALAAEKEDSQ